MSCTTKDNDIYVEIEDLLSVTKRKDFNKEKFMKNMDEYKDIMVKIYNWLKFNTSKSEYNKFYNKLVRSKGNIYIKKNFLVYVYRMMIKDGELENNEVVWSFIKKSPIRNMSGISVITVLTSPYPGDQRFSCKHDCYYCPNEPGQPRSYLKLEPAVSRANRNKFDAILQMEDRLNALLINGHEIDKLEVIIEGGTYTEYPEEYLKGFHRDLVYSANTYLDTKVLKKGIRREKLSLKEEIEINKTSKIKIIGICIETRPDAIFDENGDAYKWLSNFRNWGVTRVQIGVQHNDNDILKKVNRGHTIEDAERCMKILKDNCFKVDIHLMPDLPGSSPEKDMKMFEYIYSSEKVQADQIKIYPCEVTPYTTIKKWHDSGKYKPYAQTNERELLDVIKYAMEKCPAWVRLPRVIRDIPLTYIEGGNKYPNLRQMLDSELKNENKISMDIRSRECGRNQSYKIENASYSVRKYNASGGKELFISLESPDRLCIFGFLRLRIVGKKSKQIFKCLKNKGLIREVHVYGNLVPVGKNKKSSMQHTGVGKRLIQIAEEISADNNCDGVAVISGIGVMEYYKKLGYKYENTFMIKKLSVDIKNYELLLVTITIYQLLLLFVMMMFN
jgi:ELP3 family radical SAM enzyme/protein acetyltransferase